MSGCDLHSHSTVSDGLLSPRELVKRAAERGLEMLALTDHDNVEGIGEAMRAGREFGVTLLPGVEISADYEPGTMHLVGLGLDPSNAFLRARLDFLKAARRERNPKMAARLQALGIRVTFEEVERLAPRGQVGRPHFAQALVKFGAVKDVQEAFQRFLAKGRPAYVPKERLSPRESIQAIHQAGGAAVLAHPKQMGLEPREATQKVHELKSLGLDGIEVRCPDHSPQDEAFYMNLAKEAGLLPSGGSDYHGIPGRKGDLGEPEVPLDWAKALLKGAL